MTYECGMDEIQTHLLQNKNDFDLLLMEYKRNTDGIPTHGNVAVHFLSHWYLC